MAATGDEFVKLQQFKTAMDSKQPDMTGVVKSSDGYLSVDGSTLDGVVLGTSSMSSYTNIKNTASTSVVGAVSNGSASLGAQSLTGGHSVELKAGSSESSLTIDSKAVTSITDAISDSPAGNALVTDKAVADYVKSLIATDEEFDSVFGL